MRDRANRLFIVLLHLVGVSRNLPPTPWGAPSWQGIVGVQPMAIFLETLQLETAGGLDGLLEYLHESGYSDPEEVLSEPYWLQDDVDGKCFGPGGFSECGDATLWLVRKRSSRRRQLHGGSDAKSNCSESRKEGGALSFLWRWLRGGSDCRSDLAEDLWGFSLELIDGSLLSSSSVSSSSTSIDMNPPANMRRRINDSTEEGPDLLQEGECLLSDGLELKLGSCLKDEAWVWRINGDGILVQDELGLVERFVGEDDAFKAIRGLLQNSIPQLEPDRMAAAKLQEQYEEGTTNCVYRVNATVAATGPCSVNSDDSSNSGNHTVEVSSLNGMQVLSRSSSPRGEQNDASARLVGFSLVRYQASAASRKLPTLPTMPTEIQVETSSACKREQSPDPLIHCDQDVSRAEGEDVPTPPSARTRTNHATGPFMHPDHKPASQFRFASVSPSERSDTTEPIERSLHMSTRGVIGHRVMPKHSFSERFAGASPLTLGAAAATTHRASSQRKISHNAKLTTSRGGNKHLLHTPPTASLSSMPLLHDDAPHKPRKIPKHPYIEASTDGIWVDPDTKLEYLTDLSEYLGLDRKESGRHTLTGVGQYTRTFLKIKVYGCALYVAKRDALADAGFVPFAAHSSEELVEDEDFYNHLLTNEPTNGSFDRTLFIQTNMQLATQTMRDSLSSDWKLLTPDMKNALIASSLNPREAEERMLRKINSDDNPSRCSCGQTAAEKYNADPNCCARGTELVFTWKTSGDLELRIDGRLMDTFADPDLARGIFYEYLRGDDPMSMEARERFSDGFPFLLAPLAQIRGVKPPVLSQDGAGDVSKKASKQKGIAILRFIGSVGDGVSTQLSSAIDLMENTAEEVRADVVRKLKTAGDATRSLVDEVENKRVEAWENTLDFADEASQFFASKLPSIAKHIPSFQRREQDDKKLKDELETINEEGSTNRTDRSSSLPTRPGAKLFRPGQQLTDEIGVIIDPNMDFTRRIFLYMVHFYLMLLLIVSVPGDYSIRLVVKKGAGNRILPRKTLTDDEMSEEDESPQPSYPIESPKAPESKSTMTKSLSYFL